MADPKDKPDTEDKTRGGTHDKHGVPLRPNQEPDFEGTKKQGPVPGQTPQQQPR